MTQEQNHFSFCNNPHGPIGQDGCCCRLISSRDLAELQEKALAFDAIKVAVQDVQAKLDAKKCNRWDCLDKAMHIIDVASAATVGEYLR